VVNYSEGSEVIEFEKDDFEQLWKLTNLNAEKMRLYHFLSFCPLLTVLSE
jgi:hypothetical protein